MGESIHSLPNFEVYIAVFVDPLPQVVLFDYVFGEVGKFQSYVFVLLHGSHELEIFYIEGREARPWSGDCAVEKYFDGKEIRRWCPAFPRIVHSVAADLEARVIGV